VILEIEHFLLDAADSSVNVASGTRCRPRIQK